MCYMYEHHGGASCYSMFSCLLPGVVRLTLFLTVMFLNNSRSIREAITRNPSCPLDRRPIGIGDIYEPPPPSDLTQRPSKPEVEDGYDTGPSAKIEQLVHLLSLNPANDKSLVFSQFTSFLDKVRIELVHVVISAH
jgi:SNF2 family DNA or RNA helicase